MNTYKIALAILFNACLVQPSNAQGIPELKIEKIVIEGNGCPRNSYFHQFWPKSAKFYINFNGFKVNSRGKKETSCVSKITYRMPKGYKSVVYRSRFRGAVNTKGGAEGSLSNNLINGKKTVKQEFYVKPELEYNWTISLKRQRINLGSGCNDNGSTFTITKDTGIAISGGKDAFIRVSIDEGRFSRFVRANCPG